ncbi:hypothetical protein, partial [Streptomyces sp. NBRC 110611]|uniref:hypothetical protein n=1 Tax=Streptomyces sp. NBRC 110611 TaxID=1621259 RepID=UPI001C67109D
MADHDDPAQRGGVRRNLGRDFQVVDVHHDQARSGLLDDGGQVCCRSPDCRGTDTAPERTQARFATVYSALVGLRTAA